MFNTDSKIILNFYFKEYKDSVDTVRDSLFKRRSIIFNLSMIIDFSPK